MSGDNIEIPEPFYEDINEEKRTRAWFVTYNNPPKKLLKFEGNDMMKYLECEYIIFQHEIGESGNYHFQMFIYFKTLTSFNYMKKKLPEAHIKKCISIIGAVNYCSKLDTRVKGPFECGVRPAQGKRNDIDDCKKSIIAGAKLKDIYMNHTGTMVKFSSGMTSFYHIIKTPRVNVPNVYWFWGDTGVGKSKRAFDEASNLGSVYFKNLTKWWDLYDYEDSIIINDYRFNTDLNLEYLLNLTDRYAFIVEYKRGSLHFNSKNIFITCDVHPNEIFEGKSYKQLERRLTLIEEIKDDRIKKNSKGRIKTSSEIKMENATALFEF